MVIACMIATAGCTLPTRLIIPPHQSARATRGVVAQGLVEGADPGNQRAAAEILASPGVRAAERQLVDGLVDASVADLGESDRRARIDALVGRYLDDVAANVPARLTPAVSKMLAQSVSAALDEAVRRRGQLATLAATTTTSAVHAGTRALASDLGQLDPHAIDGLVAREAKLAGAQLVTGSTDALATKANGAGLGRITALLQLGIELLVALAIAFFLALLLLLAWTVKLRMQVARDRASALRDHERAIHDGGAAHAPV